jgi:hypothetical protein
LVVNGNHGHIAARICDSGCGLFLLFHIWHVMVFVSLPAQNKGLNDDFNMTIPIAKDE